MLSRENVIHRSAGEEGTAHVTRASATARNDTFLKPRLVGKLVLVVLIVGLLGAFLLLNRSAVVEPRLHLVFFEFARPDLLAVLLLTSFVSAAGALLVRAALQTLMQFRALRPPSEAGSSQRSALRPKEPVVARATTAA